MCRVSRRSRTFRSPFAASGVVLVMALSLLLVMTLLGVTAMTVNQQQERMAGNTRQRNLAFQSAEACLREAEARLQGANLPLFDGSTPGLRGPLDADEVGDRTLELFWLDYCWRAQAPACATAQAQTCLPLTGLAEPASYVIEALAVATPSTEDSIKLAPVNTSALYRVTARGVGEVADAVVILQVSYRR